MHKSCGTTVMTEYVRGYRLLGDIQKVVFMLSFRKFLVELAKYLLLINLSGLLVYISLVTM